MARTKRSGKSAGRGRLAGLASGLAVRVVTRPVTSGGTALMAVTATAIMVNALLLQPGRHPAPLFRDTRPVSAEDMVLAPPAEDTAGPDTIDDLVALTTGRPRSIVDPGLVTDIQNELKARGYYAGVIDGLTGPMTSAAIIRFETETGLEVTGAPTPDVLAALRAGTGPRSEAEPPSAVPSHALSPCGRGCSEGAGEGESATVQNAPIPAPRARPAPPPETDEAGPASTESVTAAAVPAAADPAATPRAEPAVVSKPERPRPDARLAEVQRALDLYGYGPLSADGFWTPETRAAVRRFEENRGLPVTGELTPAFLSELVRIGGFQLD